MSDEREPDDFRDAISQIQYIVNQDTKAITVEEKMQHEHEDEIKKNEKIIQDATTRIKHNKAAINELGGTPE